MNTILFPLIILVSLIGKLHAQSFLIPYKTKDNLYIYCDKKGKPILSNKKYQKAEFFNNERALVQDPASKLYGFIDTLGNEIIACKYNYVESFIGGVALVSLNKLYGYIDKNGKEIIKPQYVSANPFYHGFASVQKSKTKDYFLIDSLGQTVVSSKYWKKIQITNWDDSGEYLINHYEPETEIGIVNDVKGFGKKVIEDESGNRKEMLTSVSGEVLSPYSYEKIDLEYFMKNPFIRIFDRDSNSFGLIDYMGKYILPPSSNRHSIISDFDNGFAVTNKDVIDIDGHLKSVPDFSICDRYGNLITFHTGEFDRIFDLKSKHFNPASYHTISKIVNRKVLVKDTVSSNNSLVCFSGIGEYICSSKTIFRVNAESGTKEDSLMYMDFRDIRISSNEERDLRLNSVTAWNRINFVFAIDTSYTYNFHVLGYDLKKKGVVYNALQREYDLIDEQGEPVEKKFVLVQSFPILKNVILTPNDTLLLFHCYKPVKNKDGNYVGSTIRDNIVGYVFDEYFVLIDLQGVIRYEVVLPEGKENYSIITRDKDGKVLISKEYSKIQHNVSLNLEYLNEKKLFFDGEVFWSSDLKINYSESE